MKRAPANIYSIRLTDVDRDAFCRAALAAGVPRSRFLREILEDAIKAYRVYHSTDKNQLSIF